MYVCPVHTFSITQSESVGNTDLYAPIVRDTALRARSSLYWMLFQNGCHEQTLLGSCNIIIEQIEWYVRLIFRRNTGGQRDKELVSLSGEWKYISQTKVFVYMGSA